MKKPGRVIFASLQVRDRVLAPVAFVLLAVTALFTPWWGTIVVVAAMRLFFKLSVRLASFLGFAGWMIACFVRDAQGGFGPGRLLAKMFSIGNYTFGAGSWLSHLIVYVLIGVVGLMLAFLTAGFTKSVQSFVSSLAVNTSAD